MLWLERLNVCNESWFKVIANFSIGGSEGARVASFYVVSDKLPVAVVS